LIIALFNGKFFLVNATLQVRTWDWFDWTVHAAKERERERASK
jgi:hypothetical protein